VQELFNEEEVRDATGGIASLRAGWEGGREKGKPPVSDSVVGGNVPWKRKSLI